MKIESITEAEADKLLKTQRSHHPIVGKLLSLKKGQGLKILVNDWYSEKAIHPGTYCSMTFGGGKIRTKMVGNEFVFVRLTKDLTIKSKSKK